MTEERKEMYKALTESLHDFLEEKNYFGPFDVYYNYSTAFIWSLDELSSVLLAWCESASIPSVITIKKPRDGEIIGILEADVEKGFLKKFLCRRFFKMISRAVEKGHVEQVSKDRLINLIKKEGNKYSDIS